MADNFFPPSTTLSPGRDIIDTVTMLRTYWDRIVDLRNTMIQMQDNAASDDAVYIPAGTYYGFADAPTAHKFFTELDTMYQASNASITQFVARVI